jgi:hypothetical protein
MKNSKSVPSAPQFSLANWGAEYRAVDFKNADQVFKLIDELEKREIDDDDFLFFKNVSERDFRLV